MMYGSPPYAASDGYTPPDAYTEPNSYGTVAGSTVLRRFPFDGATRTPASSTHVDSRTRTAISALSGTITLRPTVGSSGRPVSSSIPSSPSRIW